MLLSYSCRPCKVIYIFALLFLFSIASQKIHAVEKQPVMGAGPSTIVAKLFFEQFSSLPVAQDYKFIVESRSIKHAGGIKASEKYLFGRTGRPLNEKEKALNKHDLFIARVPLSFVVGKKAGVTHLNIDQLEAIFTGQISSWEELGGANADILLVGREPTEAAFTVIQKELPFCNQAEFDLILTRDHQLVNLLHSSKGDYALGFGALPNFDNSYLLHIDGFMGGVNLGLVYDTRNKNHPLIKAAIDYANSQEWHRLVIDHGFLPPENNSSN